MVVIVIVVVIVVSNIFQEMTVPFGHVLMERLLIGGPEFADATDENLFLGDQAFGEQDFSEDLSLFRQLAVKFQMMKLLVKCVKVTGNFEKQANGTFLF